MKNEKIRPPNLFAYDDFRHYLADWFDYRKSQDRVFSYRSFSKSAGFASPNFLKLIIKRQRNLTRAVLPKILGVLKLTRQEEDFFSCLVDYNQATTPDDNRHYYERLVRFPQFRSIRRLEADQFDYFSEWYHVVIRELTALDDFRDDPHWIVRMLQFQITPSMAQKSLELLKRLGIIESNAAGKLKRLDTTITSGAEVRSLALRKFHKQMLQKAIDALETLPPSERDITALTIPIPRSKLPLLKEKLEQIRKEILLTLERSDESADQIFQLNLQLFPVSKRGKSS